MVFFSHTINIDIPPEDVWTALADVKGWPTWDHTLRASALDPGHQFELGATGTLKPSSGPSATFQIVRFVANSIFDVQSNLPFCNTMTVGHELKSLNNGTATELTHTLEFKGCLSFLFKRVIGKSLSRELPNVMDTLKVNLEKRS